MPVFEIPVDPLLRQAMMPRDPSPGVGNTEVQPDDLIGEGGPSLSSDEDDGSARPRNTNKRPRLGTDDEIDAENEAGPMHVQDDPHAAQPLATSLRQYVQGLISLKKFSDNSQQELHRYTTASAAERDVMTFALGLEIRDNLQAVSDAVVSSNVHPDLTKNIKVYTAAAFFSPFIRFYAPPTNSARNKDLQKSVLQQLVASGLPHIPPSSDAAGTNKVLSLIGGELTTWRSTVKDELAKRKAGEPNTDVGTFSGRLMRNTTLKITREHYGRVAFLSREYSLWESRSSGLSKMKYWEWVDQALERIRDQQKSDSESVKRFFKDMCSFTTKLAEASPKGSHPKCSSPFSASPTHPHLLSTFIRLYNDLYICDLPSVTINFGRPPELARWRGPGGTLGRHSASPAPPAYSSSGVDRTYSYYHASPALGQVMSKDEEKFSKAVGKVVSATEREEWQKKVELATSKLA